MKWEAPSPRAPMLNLHLSFRLAAHVVDDTRKLQFQMAFSVCMCARVLKNN